MKIALYCPNKPLSHPHPSGDLAIALGIRRALGEMGHQCTEVVEFRSRWFWRRPEGWIDALAALLRAYWRARCFKPRVWLTYHTYYKSPDILGPWVSRLLHIPYVLFQPMYATKRRRDSRTRVGFTLNRLAIVASSHVFINNVNDLEALQRVRHPDRITYLPPGVFPEEFRKDPEWGLRIRRRYGVSPDEPMVMTAARFRYDVKLQSLAYLFNALGILKQRGTPFMLMVVGDGPAAIEVRRMAEAHLPGQVVFAGEIPREMMAGFYSAADVFAFPGLGESLGMVFLEAQACAVPVVALHTAGVPQVVMNGLTGILVPEDGGEAMASAVERLLKDPNLRQTMGSQGLAYVLSDRNLDHNYRELSRKLLEIAA